MEAACAWLCDTLDAPGAFPLQVIYNRHTKHDDSFNLSDILSFFPEKELPRLIDLIQLRLSPTLSFLKTDPYENESGMHKEHCSALRAASEIVWLLLKQRKSAVPILRSLILALHDAFVELPSNSHDRVSSLCEFLWHAGDAERNRVVPCTMLYFLQKSFGEESGWRCNKSRSRLPGTTGNIHRVYAMRKSLETLELAETSPQSETIRHLLMRCATSSAYLKTFEGRKFLGYLLTLNDVKASTFEALMNHLGSVRNSSANFFGTVFLYAWKSKREDWLAERLMYLSEKAIQAGIEPFSTNLRVVLSTFHANKRVTGVDLLLNDIYSPVLFRNLMVANPLVRRNAVIVMSDAFPIHDPGASVQEIERTIEFQCSKLLDLLQDPCCIVRLAAIEGACRVLGLFWELVSSTYAKRVVDLLTSQMAFDTTSARIRMTVFEGLKFLLENHLSHQVLAVALPRLGSLVHDRVEMVRLSFLDLLLVVKGKRIRSLRYFDVVEINNLLLRLPTESPAVSLKIMELIRTSYFPLQRKEKTLEELAASQTRACLSMLNSNRDAARHFYRNLYLHVDPGPLLEFAMRLSFIALDAPVRSASAPVKSRYPKKKNSHQKDNYIMPNPQKVMRSFGGDENVPPQNELQNKSADCEEHPGSTTKDSADRESILITVSDVLVSISTSLRKEANKGLQAYLESIFGGEALGYLLVEKGNSLSTRAACWRIASCLSVSQVEPLIALWREQMGSVSEWHTRRSFEAQGHKDLVSALMLCGLKWNLLSSLSSFFASWCDATVNGNRAARMGTKASKRSQRRKETDTEDPRCAVNAQQDISTRAKCLYSLWLCGDAILTSEDLYDDFLRVTLSTDQNRDHHEDSFDVLTPLRKACVGVLDFYLETYTSSRRQVGFDVLLRPRFLLQVLTTTWRVCLKFATSGNIGHLFKEIQQLMQWFSSSHVWKSAFAISDQFGTALGNICLAHCADTAAVTSLTNDDLGRCEGILSYIRNEMVHVVPNTSEADHMIAEAIRLSFLLREQPFEAEAHNAEVDLGRSAKLRNTSNTLLSTVCEILSKVKADSDQRRITFSKMARYETFLRDIILDMNNEEGIEDFRCAFSKNLTASFQSENMAESGLFSRVICKIVASQIVSKTKTGPGLGFRVYNSVVRCFRCLDDRAVADHCVGNFTKTLVDCIFTHYNENDQQLKPNDNARECFAKMGALIDKEFPELDMVQVSEDSNHLVLQEALKVIALLRNMGEQDVQGNKEETASRA